ncbi:MAG: TlpA disulfide reductase family protein [Candidatus Solibacter sp.]|nr:TlpA disulfide reductase family protein [Candidatus Solibacter sp.]
MPVPRLSFAFAFALLAACLLAGCSSEPRSVKAAAPVKPDKDRRPAPEFALKDADGKTVHLEDYKGKVVLLDFFATWCGPCKIEIPWFMEMERKNKDRGFNVLGVSMDDEGWEVVKPFLADLGVNYRVVIGNDATAQLYGGVDALPTTFLIDRNAKIAAVHIGLASKKVFEDGIEQLLQGSGGIIQDKAGASRGVPLPAFTLRASAK